MTSTDRIEKRVTLRAPVSRVWRAIADAREFGRWFDRLPAHRRERAFRMNEGGWAAQAENIRKYVEVA